MTRSEIAGQTVWDDIGLGKLSLFVPLFGKELPFVLFPSDGSAPEVTEKMAATVGDVLALPPGEIERVQSLLWEECNFAFQVTWYGVDVLPGETPLQAHLREFGLPDAEAAFRKCELREIQIFDGFAARYAQVKVRTASESSISLIVRNGRIVDFDDDGTHLGAFDKDEQHAHKKRQKVLGG